MGEGVEDASAAPKPKPTILVPQREFLFASGSGPGFSPGPMTLVSNLFPEHSPFSFSQLLAGAMASPLAPKQGFLLANDVGKEGDCGSGFGHKRNRPTNLAVAPPQSQLESLSSLFVAPPGLSPGLLNSPGFLSPLQSPFGMSHQQALAHVTAQAALSQSFKQMQSEFQNSPSTDAVEGFANPLSSALTQQTNPLPHKQENSKIESSEVSQSDGKSSNASGDKSANDGYNWRKYGQKHVKASECPRSYYKCTYVNCPVKKKVERSLDGHISEITYKGQHNHEPPQQQKRGKDNSADKTANSRVNPVFTSLGQTENNRLNEVITVHSESANSQGVAQLSIEHHPISSQNDDRRNTQIAVHKGDASEPLAKRRSTDGGPPIPASSLQTISESKIVLQTRSEVDLLDDGYKWRKYGQKVVKGNPYPRSYYRCTFTGCNVRKHVERASADPKAVITTYEGKHNHDIPKGRHTGHSTGNASLQQLKTQKPILESPSINEGETEYADSDKMPTSLQLKEEEIAA